VIPWLDATDPFPAVDRAWSTPTAFWPQVERSMRHG